MNNQNRLSVDEYGCFLTLVAKSRSEDYFTHCSAVAMTPENRIIGLSYNGLKAGQEVPDWMKLEENRAKKSLFYIHAESNLFALFTKGECETLYINRSPCISCCNSIAAMGIKNVVYLKEYIDPNADVEFREILDFHKVRHWELPKESKENIHKYITEQSNFSELLS